MVKAQGPAGRNQDVGITGLFAPTPQMTRKGLQSASPQVDHPELAISVWVGDLNYQGLPQSIYSLDTSKMSKIGLASLRVGQAKSFPKGVSVRFDGWIPWASIQVSHDPAQGWLLWSALAMVLGLLGSLGVRRRRVWLRLTPSAGDAGGSLTVVTVGGLGPQ